MDGQPKTLDQELSDRYFLLSVFNPPHTFLWSTNTSRTSSFVHGLKSVLRGIAHEEGLAGGIETMDAKETIHHLHTFHINAGKFSHQLKLKAVRLFPAFFNAPYSGAQLLDVDYRPIIECLRKITKDIHENPSSKQQDDFWLYGPASTFYDTIIMAHLNSIYHEGSDDGSNVSTPPDDSRYRTSWCGLLVAVQLYTEQVVTLWRPFKREIFLHSLRILQRDITFALRKPGSPQLAELLFWESFLGLISTYGHEEEGDMDLEPGFRPFFEEIVRSQSKVMRLYTWEDVRWVLMSVLWPAWGGKDTYMCEIWEAAMARVVGSEG
jgi:hypothetical protein